MTLYFTSKKGKKAKAARKPVDNPVDNTARFQKKHAKCRTSEIQVAKGAKTMTKCHDCGCAHFRGN